jgi:hypothetical protein
MNPWMVSDLADSQVREIRRQVAECRTGRQRPVPRRVSTVTPLQHLRHRVGFGLVEAGLHVLASTRPAP